jgi:hypothetical protein
MEVMTKKSTVRTLSEILKDADSTRSISELKALSRELFDYKYEYKISEVSYGLEHIKDICLEIKSENTINALLNDNEDED